MGHIVFATPGIADFHLHEILGRRLLRRGHAVSVWAADPVTANFYRAQGMRTALISPRKAGPELRGLPIDEAARRDCLLRGTPARPPSAASIHSSSVSRARKRIGAFVPDLLRQFSVAPPDLVLCHGRRSGISRIVQHLATEFGSGTLHTGPGLVPGTMQWDRDGVDGDSSKMRRQPADYARGPRDEGIVMAALAGVLGGATAQGLDRVAVARPGLADRCGAIVNAMRLGQFGPAFHGFGAWRRARRPAHAATRDGHASAPLPDGPFVAVLLQDSRSAALRLDADSPSQTELAVAARRAACSIDPSIPVVLVAPHGCRIHPRDLAAIERRTGPVQVVADEDRMTAVTTALAVVTVNEAHGLVAILAGTPLLHTGRSLYAHAGVSTPTTLDTMREDLAAAVERPNPPHRASYLTRTLVYDHVWCHDVEPDQNGMRGLVQTVESHVASQGGPDEAGRLAYRAGPAWPLTEDARDEESSPSR